jgi:predicted DNA-binding protein (MmcQ/YjbR family)
VKASEIAREALAGTAGVSPAPTLARAGWLRIADGAMADAAIADMIRVSHALVAAKPPAKARSALESAGACPAAPRRARNAP